MAFALFPIWGALIIELWLLFILPYLISSYELENKAAEILQRFPDDPLQSVDREIYVAWTRSDSFTVGKLFRVKSLLKTHCKKTNWFV